MPGRRPSGRRNTGKPGGAFGSTHVPPPAWDLPPASLLTLPFSPLEVPWPGVTDANHPKQASAWASSLQRCLTLPPRCSAPSSTPPSIAPTGPSSPNSTACASLARFDGHDLTLLSRNNKPQESRFPEVVEGLRRSLRHPAIIDGEVVCLDESGKTSFRELQQRFHLDDAEEIRRRMERHPAYLYAFDVLYLHRFDVTRLPLSRRQELLREALTPSDRIRITESTPSLGIENLRRACEAAEEGIIGKRLDSLYVPGRSDAWVKIKCVGRQEFVIAGWTDPQRSRVGLGALLVGYYEGERLRYAGKVGTGYTREVLLDLRKRFDELGHQRPGAT